VVKLKAAQVRANVARARESLAAKKREQEKLLAIAAEKQDQLKQISEQLKAANDSAAKSKLKAALKTATAEAKSAEAAAKKSATELASEQSHFDKLTADYERAKTALLSSAQPSSLVR
jgi:chromosome segregation ATPase